jgi:prepilin signal peptidase PulO-like enzyme (type II secretory pathway)
MSGWILQWVPCLSFRCGTPDRSMSPLVLIKHFSQWRWVDDLFYSKGAPDSPNTKILFCDLSLLWGPNVILWSMFLFIGRTQSGNYQYSANYFPMRIIVIISLLFRYCNRFNKLIWSLKDLVKLLIILSDVSILKSVLFWMDNPLVITSLF